MVYGLFVPVILSGFIVVILSLPCMAGLIDVPLCLLIILLPLLILALVIFPFAWYDKTFSSWLDSLAVNLYV